MIQPHLSDKNKEQSDIPSASSISVAIVSYNSRELLRDCLASIESERWKQVIVIDNASTDGSYEMVRQDFPWVKLISSGKNDGYGAAANRAITSCSSEYVLLLNCDTLVQPGSVQALSSYLDQHPQVAIAGPHLVNPDGTSQISCFRFPTPLQILMRDTSLSPFIRRFYNSFLDESHHDDRNVPWVLGAALAIRRLAFDAVGGFDESFFMYFEEVDLCYRLYEAGWEVHFARAARVTHLGGGSTKQHHAVMEVQLYKSLWHFYLRHYSGSQRFLLRLVITYLMLRNIVRDRLRAARAKKQSANNEPNNLPVWRSVLFYIWSANGSLKDRSVAGDGS